MATMKLWLGHAASVGLLATASSATAQSTTTYTYDALGRLTASRVAGGPANGTATDIGLDPAGNRTSYRVAGATNQGGNTGNNGDGAAAPTTRRVIVVPLNGFTIIPIDS